MRNDRGVGINYYLLRAEVVELADTYASEAYFRKEVRVRFPSSADYN